MSMKRAIIVSLKGGEKKELILSKATELQDESFPGMLHLDELKDGTWRLTFTRKAIGEFKNIEKIEIIRED